jgi:hypothetical protein
MTLLTRHEGSSSPVVIPGKRSVTGDPVRRVVFAQATGLTDYRVPALRLRFGQDDN